LLTMCCCVRSSNWMLRSATRVMSDRAYFSSASWQYCSLQTFWFIGFMFPLLHKWQCDVKSAICMGWFKVHFFSQSYSSPYTSGAQDLPRRILMVPSASFMTSDMLQNVHDISAHRFGIPAFTASKQYCVYWLLCGQILDTVIVSAFEITVSTKLLKLFMIGCSIITIKTLLEHPR